MYEEQIIYCKYNDMYLNMNKMMDNEDDEDYFDNTIDLLDKMDDITFNVDDKVTFTLSELCSIDEDLIYHVGRKDGFKYVSDLIDHIYHGGYSGDK